MTEFRYRFYIIQNIFPLANSFAKWENVRRWQAPYGTQMGKINTFLMVFECIIKYCQMVKFTYIRAGDI